MTFTCNRVFLQSRISFSPEELSVMFLFHTAALVCNQTWRTLNSPTTSRDKENRAHLLVGDEE